MAELTHSELTSVAGEQNLRHLPIERPNAWMGEGSGGQKSDEVVNLTRVNLLSSRQRDVSVRLYALFRPRKGEESCN